MKEGDRGMVFDWKNRCGTVTKTRPPTRSNSEMKKRWFSRLPTCSRTAFDVTMSNDPSSNGNASLATT